MEAFLFVGLLGPLQCHLIYFTWDSGKSPFEWWPMGIDWVHGGDITGREGPNKPLMSCWTLVHAS